MFRYILSRHGLDEYLFKQGSLIKGLIQVLIVFGGMVDLLDPIIDPLHLKGPFHRFYYESGCQLFVLFYVRKKSYYISASAYSSKTMLFFLPKHKSPLICLLKKAIVRYSALFKRFLFISVPITFKPFAAIIRPWASRYGKTYNVDSFLPLCNNLLNICLLYFHVIFRYMKSLRQLIMS